MADPNSRASAHYGGEALRRWVDGVHSEPDAALRRAFEADAAHGLPSIQLGLPEGQLLQLLAALSGARRALEIGTLAGFSAIHLARGMGPDGRLLTLESDPRHAAIARENLEAAGLGDRVEVRLGDAVETLPAIEGPFDLVFLDADKGRYDHYGRWAAEHMRVGGLLIADNAFFFGRLLEDDPEAAAMRRFHEEAALVFDTHCVPTPDGLLVGRRRKERRSEP